MRRLRTILCAALLTSGLFASLTFGADFNGPASVQPSTVSAAGGRREASPPPPIAISTVQELQKIGNDSNYPLDGSYVLAQDIDASETATWNDNGTGTDWPEGFLPIGYGVSAFAGVLDGQGHSITGLVIHRPNYSQVGLFSRLGSAGQIRNVSLVNCSISGDQGVGSLVGEDYGAVTNCDATGTVSGTTYVGGLIGGSYADNTTVSLCHAACEVSGHTGLGGLMGGNLGTITDSYATGRVTATAGGGGGLAAGNTGHVTRCHATGAVSGTTAGTGGLLGGNDLWVTECYATGPVSGMADVGGLIGNCGGLEAEVTYCYATGAVTTTGTYVEMQAGGLVGYVWAGRIDECFASGPVSGTTNVGGLVGRNDDVVAQCYATGSVSGTGPVGGLVGENVFGSVTDCYASGMVLGTGDGFGGLVGKNYATVTGSYWDTQTSGQATSDGGTGKTTAAMKRQSTFSGWDFSSVWAIVENVTYPYLLKGVPLPAPTGFVASNGSFSDRIRASWTAPLGVTYSLYRSTCATTATAIALTGWSVETTSFDDLSAEPGVLYYYWVRAATNSAGASASGFSPCDSGWAGFGPPLPKSYRGTLLIVR